MELFPAIDLSGGRVVRLRQGDFEDMRVYSGDPLFTARSFAEQGAANLHVVDLDAAKAGQAKNMDCIRQLCAVPGLFVQVGGGVRDEARIEELLSLGAGRVILGTAAVRNFPFLQRMVRTYEGRIAVGVDAKGGKVAISGWLETAEMDPIAFCRRLADAGVGTVIYTDVSRDGELAGANLAAYQALREVPVNVIASGGVSFEHELTALRKMGTYGAVIGKALYAKKLDLRRCVALAQGKEPV